MSKQTQSRSPPPVAPVPHSWGFADWPPSVFPNTTERARQLVRAHRVELLDAGALVRVGRQLVVIGQPYAKWLQRKASRVQGYVIAPNRPRDERIEA